MRFSPRGASRFRARWRRLTKKRANPWLLPSADVRRRRGPGRPDANSMTMLHRALGESRARGASDAVTLRWRPARQRAPGRAVDGGRNSAPLSRTGRLSRLPREHAARGGRHGVAHDRGSRVTMVQVAWRRRLAEFHRVENTYLSTFQIVVLVCCRARSGSRRPRNGSSAAMSWRSSRSGTTPRFPGDGLAENTAF